MKLGEQGIRGGTVVCCGGLLRGDVEPIGASVKSVVAVWKLNDRLLVPPAQ